MSNKKCKYCGEIWYPGVEYCLCGNNRFWDSDEDWVPKESRDD